MEFALLLLLMFAGGGAKPPTPAYYLRMRVKNDAEGVSVLEYLDKTGKVVEMMNFDGKNVEVIWRSNSAEGVVRALDDAGVDLREMRTAKPVAP